MFRSEYLAGSLLWHTKIILGNSDTSRSKNELWPEMNNFEIDDQIPLSLLGRVIPG